jgi:PKD repeat protein
MSTRASLLALLMIGAACTVQQTPPPALAGPSELALRVALQAIPDAILQDGISQAVILIDAAGPDGRPTRGLSVRADILFDGTIQDFGTLSAKTVVTGDDGRARITYTAPPRPGQPIDPYNVVTIRVTPIGTDFRGEVARTVDLRLLPPGVLLPPNPGAPVPQFTMTPNNPAIFTNVVFDASATTDDGAVCGALCGYSWDFGDGYTASGIFTMHQYSVPFTYQVRLTVTDARGASSTTAQPITVGGGTPPTAAFTYSPSQPALSQLIFFTAEASRAATGRQIVSYDWNFGSGRTGSGVTISKGYDVAGTYTVTLTVTDDAGLQATTTQQVTVGAAGTGPQATLTVSPGSGTTATTFFFDASGTRGPTAIVEYRFTFGDATTDVVGQSPTTTHRFSTPGSYTVSVTARDTANRTSIARVTVSVQ